MTIEPKAVKNRNKPPPLPSASNLYAESPRPTTKRPQDGTDASAIAATSTEPAAVSNDDVQWQFHNNVTLTDERDDDNGAHAHDDIVYYNDETAADAADKDGSDGDEYVVPSDDKLNDARLPRAPASNTKQSLSQQKSSAVPPAVPQANKRGSRLVSRQATQKQSGRDTESEYLEMEASRDSYDVTATSDDQDVFDPENIYENQE